MVKKIEELNDATKRWRDEKNLMDYIKSPRQAPKRWDIDEQYVEE
jgi:hypothetical protein